MQIQMSYLEDKRLISYVLPLKMRLLEVGLLFIEGDIS